MNTFLDRAGQEVKVGDFIVYGHALGRCAGLQFGRVLSIKSIERQRFSGIEEHWRIRAQGVNEDYNKPQLIKPGTLKYPDRIILANDFIPQKLKDLFDGPAQDPVKARS